MVLNLFVVFTFLASVLLGVVTIPRIVLISRKKRLFDEISERKMHHGNIPRLGGVAFSPAFLFSVSLGMGLRYYFGFEVNEMPLAIEVFRESMMLITGLTMIFFTGLADDLTGLSYKSKFVMQIAAACTMLYGSGGISNMGGLFGLYELPAVVGGVLTVGMVVLMMNAYNLIDGIDGLCSGLSLLALGTLCVWFWWIGLYVYAMLVAGICGVLSVFFFYNVSKARMKIFMGDTGSLTLGYMIAFFGLKFYNLNIDSDLYNIQAAPAILLGLVLVPVFDTMRVFIVRIKSGLSPFYPDKRHIHHKILRLGLTHAQSALTIILIQIGFMLFNILLSQLNVTLLVLSDIVLWCMMILILDFLGSRAESRRNAAMATPNSESQKMEKS